MATSAPKRKVDAAPMVTRMVYYYLGQADSLMIRSTEIVDGMRWPGGTRPRHIEQLLEEMNAWQAKVREIVAQSLRAERDGGN